MTKPQKQGWFHRLRRFNRRWIDQLDPDWPLDESAPASQPATSHSREWRAFEGERTPNPNALKFHVGRSVDQRTLLRDTPAPEDPLNPLLDVPGVVSVFAVEDFVTVLKGTDASWDDVLPDVQHILKGVFH